MILSTFLLILAYLMGSICSAVIVCKTFNLPDPRTEGSKNPGATNVLRIAGKKYAIMVLVIDLLKGTIPVLIARMFGVDMMFLGFIALAAVVGHMYPIFFNFMGGKGVATAIGALLGFQGVVGIMVVATWLLLAKFTRYSSLASIVSICLAPFYALLVIGEIGVFPPLFVIALLILSKHKENISRLLEGTESKINLKKEAKEVVVEQVIVKESVTMEVVAEAPQETKTPAAKEKSAKTTAKKSTKTAGAEEKPAKKASTAKKPAAKKTTTKKPKEEPSA